MRATATVEPNDPLSVHYECEHGSHRGHWTPQWKGQTPDDWSILSVARIVACEKCEFIVRRKVVNGFGRWTETALVNA